MSARRTQGAVKIEIEIKSKQMALLRGAGSVIYFMWPPSRLAMAISYY